MSKDAYRNIQKFNVIGKYATPKFRNITKKEFKTQLEEVSESEFKLKKQVDKKLHFPG